MIKMGKKRKSKKRGIAIDVKAIYQRGYHGNVFQVDVHPRYWDSHTNLEVNPAENCFVSYQDTVDAIY